MRTGIPVWRGLDHDLRKLRRIFHLSIHQREIELMVLLQQTGRIDQVGSPNRVEYVGDGDAGRQQLGGIGSDMKLRLLSALHHHGGHAIETIEARLQIVGCHRPELRLRDRVGGEAVADDGKAGEVQAMRLDDGCRRQLGANAGERRVHQLQRGDHVHVPVEEKIDFSRAAAGDGAHLLQSGHAVDRLFDGTRDGDHHLVDRHHAVVDADDNARKIGGREN